MLPPPSDMPVKATWFITPWVFENCLFKAQPQGLLLSFWVVLHKNTSSWQWQPKHKTPIGAFQLINKKSLSSKFSLDRKFDSRENVPSWSCERILVNRSCQVWDHTPVVWHKVKRTVMQHPNVVHASSWAVRGCHGLSLNIMCLPWVLSFLMFPSVFVFVHICLYQIAHLHWVDLPALAVANLMTRNTR